MDFVFGMMLFVSLVLSGSAVYIHMKNKNKPMEIGTGMSYLIPKKRKGYFLLINNNAFFNPEDDTWTTREGSNKDAENLEKLFKDIGFEVVRMDNLKAQAIVDAFKRMTKLIEKENDGSCFAAAILSHGAYGGVFGTDWGYVQTESILNIMSDDNCPSLKGKPRLIFIQACQNEDSLGINQGFPGTLIDASFPDAKRETTQVSLKPDFFLSLATPLGNLAFRHPEEGSYYVNALVKVFRKYANDTDLTTLMMKVRKEVMTQVDQVPGEKTTLTKSFFFNPLNL